MGMFYSNALEMCLVVMAAFCIQGDNVQDAVAMADRVDAWMNINASVSPLP